jgi:L,D-transpeptidase ErfK/SrfK
MMLRFGLLLLGFAAVSNDAAADIYELPEDGSDLVGEIRTVIAKHEDTLVDIARRHGVGYQDIVRANPGVDVWVPGEGTEVVLPTLYVLPPGPREGIVLNLAEYRLYYFPQPADGEPAVVMTYPISIGRRDWETPIGTTRIVAKAVDPSWYPPESIREEHAAEGRPLPRVVPPGPDNPLGRHAIRLALPGYLIHGTNRPAGVGMRVTHGCLRMFPEDIEYLFPRVAIDAKVRIINEPVKIGWSGDELVMEVHPVLESAPATPTDEPQRETSSAADSGEAVPDGADSDVTEEQDAAAVVAATDEPDDTAVDAEHPPAEKDPLTLATEQFIIATGERPGQLDWERVETVIARADGMPVTVGEGIKNAATSAAFE